MNPTIFAIAIVFGGSIGMTSAALFGLDAGGGFVLGSAILFVVLTLAQRAEVLGEALLASNRRVLTELIRFTSTHGDQTRWT